MSGGGRGHEEGQAPSPRSPHPVLRDATALADLLVSCRSGAAAAAALGVSSSTVLRAARGHGLTLPGAPLAAGSVLAHRDTMQALRFTGRTSQPSRRGRPRAGGPVPKTRSAAAIADDLTRLGYDVSASSVLRALRQHGLVPARRPAASGS